MTLIVGGFERILRAQIPKHLFIRRVIDLKHRPPASSEINSGGYQVHSHAGVGIEPTW